MIRYVLFIPLFCLAFDIAYSAEPTCFRYEPATATLKGEVRPVVFPGPPNFESVENGDEPERYWVLFLPKAICVAGNPEDPLNSQSQKNVTSLQLMIDDYNRYRALLGKPVSVKGRLMHALSGQHHTQVLFQVDRMAPGR